MINIYVIFKNDHGSLSHPWIRSCCSSFLAFFSSCLGEAAAKIVTGGRQLRATLRESFRKIRKIRSQVSAPTPITEASTAKGTHLSSISVLIIWKDFKSISPI